MKNQSILLSFPLLIILALGTALGQENCPEGDQKTLCQAFQMNFQPDDGGTGGGEVNCDQSLNSQIDPSGQQNLFCKALKAGRNPQGSCEDPNFNNLIQFKSLCYDLKNFLRDRPCFFWESNGFCKVTESLLKYGDCEHLAPDTWVQAGGGNFFKENKFFLKNEKSVCEALQHSGVVGNLAGIKKSFSEKFNEQLSLDPQMGEKAISKAYLQTRDSPHKIKSNITINIENCKLNLTQVIEDTTPDIDKIEGWRFPHQEYLLVDLKKGPLTFRTDRESGWGNLHFYLNDKEFHTDSAELLDHVLNLSQSCLKGSSLTVGEDESSCHQDPITSTQSALPEILEKVLDLKSGKFKVSIGEKGVLGSLQKWGDLGPEVSVLTKKKVQETFDDLVATGDVPFNYAFDQCFSRSFIFGKKLAEKGVEAGQVFAFAPHKKYLKVTNPLAESPIYYYYHVAPFVLMINPENGKLEMMVFDPSLYDKAPLTMKDWISVMTSHDRRLKKQVNVEVRNRFAYGPAGASMVPQNQYITKEVEDAQAALEETRKLLGNNQRIQKTPLPTFAFDQIKGTLDARKTTSPVPTFIQPPTIVKSEAPLHPQEKMQPMIMGDMEMQPGKLKMGNMVMELGKPLAPLAPMQPMSFPPMGGF